MSSFIFTIGYNCPLVVNCCLFSFFKNHNREINIICSSKDAELIAKFDQANIIIDDSVAPLFQNGHKGTARVWANIISGKYGNYDSIINIDSDVIFRCESLSLIDVKLFDHDLVGPRRSYLMNKAGPLPPEFHSRPEVVSTYILGVRTEKVDKNNLEQKCAGLSSDGGPILDFFDPISFEILRAGGKIYHLDSYGYGSSDEDGSFDNTYSLNQPFDCGSRLIHFAGIGSGSNFTQNGNGNVPSSYTDWAKERYKIYSDIFFNTSLSGDPVKKEILEYLQNAN